MQNPPFSTEFVSKLARPSHLTLTALVAIASDVRYARKLASASDGDPIRALSKEYRWDKLLRTPSSSAAVSAPHNPPQTTSKKRVRR